MTHLTERRQTMGDVSQKALPSSDSSLLYMSLRQLTAVRRSESVTGLRKR